MKQHFIKINSNKNNIVYRRESISLQLQFIDNTLQ